MSRNRMLRHVRWLILALPATAALAQVPPPPPLRPLGPPPQPPGNVVTVARANLGKVLFWDEQLSTSRTVACGSCHQAGSGGSDPRSIPGSTVALDPGPDGIAGTADDITASPGSVLHAGDGALAWSSVYGLSRQVTGRRAPSHIDAAYAPVLFWDGRASGSFTDPVSGDTLLPAGGALESQSVAPPVSSTEMGHLGRDWNDVATRVAGVRPLALATSVPAALASWIGGRGYPQLFQEAFGSSQVTPGRIAFAIASYERTLFSTRTPFDSVIAGAAALTGQEAAGFQLFGALPCARCHGGALTSDNAFHYIGVRPVADDSGRAAVTHDPRDLGAVKTPILRNVALRRSYMHDGRFATLDQVVDFYDRGGDFDAPNKDPLIRPLHLTPNQKASLLAFLRRPLTDPRVAGSQSPFDRPLLYSESALVPEVGTGGVAGGGGTVPQMVALEPPLAGNPAFTVGIFGALGGAAAVLVIDDQEPPQQGGIPASASFARIAVTLSGAGATGGWGSAAIAIPDDPALYGRTLHGRWYVSDPGAPGGVAASAPFTLRVFGPNGAGLPSTGVPTTALVGVRLYTSQPNPFGAIGTMVRFDLHASTNVKLTVYDVTGRRVRALLQPTTAMPGAYAVKWDGADDQGRLVPGGVYYYRLQTDRGDATSKAVRSQ